MTKIKLYEYDIICVVFQVSELGCKAFALLFDDIEPCLMPMDRGMFDSVAQAQSHVTNQMYLDLGKPEVFLFCPTGTSLEFCLMSLVYSS